MNQKKVDSLEHEHDSDSIRQRIHNASHHSYLKDFIYGAIDGTVTTFAVVSGVAGAGLSSEVIIILGLANLVGDGFSMAASNFVGCRTDQQLMQLAREMEHRHIAVVPAGEREEVREIFRSKGFEGEDLDKVVDVITADEELWVDTMLVDELGVPLHSPSPIKAALTTFVAFIFVGLLPLLAFIGDYFVPLGESLLYPSCLILTATAFFAIGAAKSFFVNQRWYWSGLETLTIGCVAAGLAFLIGHLLGGLIEQ